MIYIFGNLVWNEIEFVSSTYGEQPSHCFNHAFTYILMPHIVMILNFHLPSFHVSNRLHSTLVLSFHIDLVLLLSISNKQPRWVSGQTRPENSVQWQINSALSHEISGTNRITNSKLSWRFLVSSRYVIFCHQGICYVCESFVDIFQSKTKITPLTYWLK